MPIKAVVLLLGISAKGLSHCFAKSGGAPTANQAGLPPLCTRATQKRSGTLAVRSGLDQDCACRGCGGPNTEGHICPAVCLPVLANEF